MRKYSVGLGIFALIFSLNLFFSGSIGVPQSPPEIAFSSNETSQEQISSDYAKAGTSEGTLRHKTESSEVVNLVRRYPAALSVFFFLFSPQVSENPVQLFAADHSFFPVRDLSLAFHNLRI